MRVNERNKMTWNDNNPKSTNKCCSRLGTLTGELLKFCTIVDHKKMHVNNLNYDGSPYILIILWKNGQITGVPLNQVMHNSPKECIKYVTDNELNINKDSYDRISTTTQLTHAIMKLALGMKSGRISLAIELYDAFNFKLLLLDITDIDQLMAETHNNKLNDLLESIHQHTFHQGTIQKITVLIAKAQKILASTYSTPSEEIFNTDQVTGHDKELNNTTNTNKELRENLLLPALDMTKT